MTSAGKLSLPAPRSPPVARHCPLWMSLQAKLSVGLQRTLGDHKVVLKRPASAIAKRTANPASLRVQSDPTVASAKKSTTATDARKRPRAAGDLTDANKAKHAKVEKKTSCSKSAKGKLAARKSCQTPLQNFLESDAINVPLAEVSWPTGIPVSTVTFGSDFDGLSPASLVFRTIAKDFPGFQYLHLWSSENDPLCKKVIRNYGSDCHIHDVCQRSKTVQPPSVTVHIQTPPCQTFSPAGKGAGFDDEKRGRLFFTGFQYVLQSRPDSSIFECSAGITRKKFQGTLAWLLKNSPMLDSCAGANCSI